MLSDAPLMTSPRAGRAGPGWRDPVLVGAVLVIVGLSGYQLGVTLLQPPWLSLVSVWLLAVLAWLALLGVVLFSRWASRAHLPGRRSWWLLSAGLCSYALARTFWLIGYVRYAGHLPMPWWSDLFHVLGLLCYFLAVLLIPSAPEHHRTEGLARLRLLFDSLLLMGAATLLTWVFLLAPIPLHSGPALPRTLLQLAYPIADLGLLFLLTWLLLKWGLPAAGQEILGLLLVAFTYFIVGNSWYAALTLSGYAQAGGPPDLFWLLGFLCFPLAALVRFRQVQQERVPPAVWSVKLAGLGLERQDVLEGLRLFLPFWAALGTCGLILVRTLLQVPAEGQRLLGLLVSASLFGVLLLRQGVVFLQEVQVRREREAARAGEHGVRETNRQMELFLGIVSHELKTPLTSILLGLERLHRCAQALRLQLSEGTRNAVVQVETLHRLSETTLQQAGRMNRLVQELLETARIQAGQFELNVQPADLEAIVRSAVQEQRQVALERTILLHECGGGPVLVSADADRLGQVVTNFLSNALRYSEEAKPVEVGVQVEGGQGRVWVRDQGPGIPLDEQKRLWERFHRVPGIAVQSGSGVGLGIGLYLSKKIMEQHGGQVGVQSAKGAGSTFWCTLPLASEEQGGTAWESLGSSLPPPDVTA
jgi:signal transduction histidine kinase